MFPVPWDREFIDAPPVVKKKQNTPCFTCSHVTQIVMRAIGQFRVLFVLLAASGLRIGEALGLRIENVRDEGRWLIIVEKNWKGKQQDFLKTNNGEREIDLHSSVAAMLWEHIGSRTSGFVFLSRRGKAHSQLNIIKRYLHPILLGDGKTPRVTGWKAGNHAFRRFRDTYLRNEARTPDSIIKYWMGHAGKDMTDLYDKAGTWRKTRCDEAERAGIGFTLPEKNVSCTECTEKTKTAAGVAAV